MSEPLIDTILASLKAELPDLAGASLNAARHLLSAARKDLEHWSAQVATGHLSAEELEWLARSRLDVLRMETLRETGLAHARLDALRRRLVVHIVQALLPAA